MMRSRAGHNRLKRILWFPIRVLRHARDFYVRSMTEYADRVGYGNMGCAGGQYPALPRSFSSASRSTENDDLRELIRAVSARRLGERTDVDASLRKRRRRSKVMALPKSRSVGMDRIEEDDFEGDDNSRKKNGVWSSFDTRRD